MSEAPILYITGTNTGVGKTTLAIELLKREALERIGFRTIRQPAKKARDGHTQIPRFRLPAQGEPELRWFAIGAGLPF